MKPLVSVAACILFITIAAPRIAEADQLDKARRRMALIQIQQLGSAVDLFKLTCAVYPTKEQGLEALVKDPGVKGWKGPYINKIPKDPWGTAYRYATPKDPGFRIDSAGPDKKFDTDDDVRLPEKKEE